MKNEKFHRDVVCEIKSLLGNKDRGDLRWTLERKI